MYLFIPSPKIALMICRNTTTMRRRSHWFLKKNKTKQQNIRYYPGKIVLFLLGKQLKKEYKMFKSMYMQKTLLIICVYLTL